MIRRVCIFLLFISIPLFAQLPPLYEFEHYDVGNSESNILGVFTDSRGFVWIRTEAGVLRYDGRDFLHLKKELAAAYVMDIAESPDGSLWFATSGGITRLNIPKWEFTNFYHNTEDGDSLGQFFVNDLHFDSKGILWIAHDLGIDRYSEEKNIFIHYGLNPEYNPQKDSGPWGGKIYEDSSGSFWVGYQNPALLDSFDPLTGEFHSVSYRSSDTNQNREFVRDLYEYEEKLWISTSKTGLYARDILTNETTHYAPDFENPQALPAPDVYQCFGDSTGKFWIVSDGALSLLSPDFTTFTHLYPDKDDPMKMKNSPDGIAEDKAGNLWVVSWSDLYRSSLNTYSFETIPTDSFASFMINDPSGGYWISTIGSGLLHLDKESLIDGRYFENGRHYSIHYDRDGVLWTNESGVGLHRLMPGNEKFDLFLQEEINEELQWAMVSKDNLGNIWALGWERPYFWDSDKGEFSPFIYDHLNDETGVVESREFSGWDLRMIFIDRRGGTWIGSGDGLFLSKSDGTGHIKFLSDSHVPGSLSNNTITGIVEDNFGDIWISTLEGLNRYLKDSESFEVYDLSDSLSGDGFASLVQDNSGLFWLGTTKGIVRFDPVSKDYALFDSSDGVFSAGGISCASIDEMGHIYMGGFAGVTRFDPSLIKRRTFIPPVHFTGYDVGESGAGITHFFSSPERLDLSWATDSISLSYAALDLTNPDRIRYAVKLQGWDDNWLFLNNKNSIRYTNLPGGSYKFIVKATNTHGLWTPEEAWGELPIFVTTHPLKSWWAITFYVICILCSIFVFFHRYHSVQNRKLVQERLVSDRLRDVDNLKDQFLANTTHELRTPLNGIIGLAESLIDKGNSDVSEGTKKELSLIASSGRRLSFLINDILDLSRLKEGDIILNKSPVDLARLVNTVLVLSSPLLAGRDVKLINHIPNDFPLAEGDINRIQQILHNLIGNAIKFTSQGEITISAIQSDSFIEVEVRDTGIGVPEEKQDIIWKSFHQIDGSSDRAFGGTGLGLPITRQLVELHGGDIRLESSPGKGSSFYFTLPASRFTLQNETVRTTASILMDYSNQEIPEEQRPGEISASIFIVDDEAVNRHVVESQLRGKGYDLTTFASGKEALEILLTRPPDLILLDIMMPEMDGYEVCRRIRERYTANELPVIMITAKNQATDLVEGLAVGANDFIAKPYSGKELVARIVTHLELKRSHDVYGKFIPKELIEMMDSQKRDSIEKDMTVVFTSFSTKSQMKKRSIFSFLTAILPEVLPVIRKNNGIIHRYEGEGVLSFFPGSAFDAIKASLEIHELVSRFNRERKPDSSLHVESSLHGEKMLIGLAGDEQFSDKIVISGAIEQTLKLNVLAKHLDCALVASESVIEKNLMQNEKRVLTFLYRDDIQLYIKAYEFFPTDSISGELKVQSSFEYEEGLKLFYDHQYNSASIQFGKVLNVNPHDHAAQIYKERCLYYQNYPPESDILTII